MTFSCTGAAMQTGQVEHTLGDDFAAVCIGESDQFARRRYIHRAAEDRSVPSAQENGFPLVLTASARLTATPDVVSGLNGQNIGEVSCRRRLYA
jgi:hypothetical protein